MKLCRTVVWSVVVASLVAPVCRAESPHVARLLGNAVADAVDKAMPAVPANLAMRIADSLVRTGRAERPWLGIRLRDVAPTLGEAGTVSGVQVGEVLGNTPASTGGLKAGDFILAVDESAVTDSRAVQRAVFKRNLGDSVKLRVIREGRELEFDIITEAMPDPGRLEK